MDSSYDYRWYFISDIIVEAMNVIFVPTLGLDISLLDRLADSVDYHVRSKVVWNNGEPGALEDFRNRHDDWQVKESPYGNTGVAGAWNQCAKMFPEEQSWLIANDDCYFLPGYLEKICKCADEHKNEPIVHLNSSNAYYNFIWTARGKRDFGEFDENFWPAYCLSPDTRVLRDDLRWVEIGSLKKGDTLIGVEETPVYAAGRRYALSIVTSVHYRAAPSVRVSFEDGRQVVCSTDHKWLTKFPIGKDWKKQSGGILWRWKPMHQIRPGWRVYAPLRAWGEDRSFDAGWLSGILDGEGCVRASDKMRGVSFSQNGGDVLNRAKSILTQMGIRYTVQRPPDGCYTVEISTKRDALELLGRLRPTRLFPQHNKLWDGGVFVRSRNVNSDLCVQDIEPIGMQEVVTIETTSKTFIANGLVSHNCEDNDMRIRHRLKGYNGYVYALEGLPPLPHGKPRTGGVNYNALLQGCGLLNREYWLRKWGNQDFHGAPTYQTPYNDQRLTVDQWVWYPDDRAVRRRLWDSFMSLPNPSIYE